MAAADAPPPTSPPTPETPLVRSEPAASPRAVRHLALKAALLLGFTMVLVIGTALYLLYARGFFEPTQPIVLTTDDSEGVVAGMDLTFSGFPIGTVRKVELGPRGDVRILVDVNRKDARFLRTSSVFTLVKGVLGAAQLRAYSGVLSDPPLPENAERPVLRGDANEQLQRVIGAAHDVIENLGEITASNSELNRSLANLHVFTQKLQGRQGALHAVFGNEEDARKLVAAIERANTAMARIETLANHADQLVAHADRDVFGPGGLSAEARTSMRQLNALLADARASLQRVDGILVEAQGIAGNVRGATADLGSLRGEVEANLRKIEDLINDLNRRWPFAKDRKIELP